MTKNIFAEVDDLAKKLSPEEKQQIKGTNKFMYELKEGTVSIFPLNLKEGCAVGALPSGEKTLEKLSDQPLISISKEEIEHQNLAGLPNMYYPCINPDVPVEIKAAYFLLKTMAGKGIVNWHAYAELYDCQKYHLGDLILARGR